MSDQSIAFVSTGELPDLPPPENSTGIIGWAREKLFSSKLNTIITVLAIAFVAMILADILPWFLNSTWDAGSLTECRERGTGACFAVINKRFTQFIYGFYPMVERWRPNLTFVLLFVALAPVLFDKIPKKALWFSALYPVLGYWLLWGGSVWGVVAFLAGPVLAFVLFMLMTRSNIAGAVALGISALGLLLYWYFLIGPISNGLSSALGAYGLEPVTSDQFGGFILTLIIGISGIAASLPLGILLALGRKSDLMIVKAICVGFIEFIRGVPLITLLFVASTLLNYFLPPGTNFDIILRVVIMVTLFASAYMAEVIRGGLAALPRGQYEAADALGLNYWESMRLIVLPQALKISIPGIVNTFIGLFKDTTLVSIIGLLDPLGIINPIRADQNWNGIVWELYGFVAVFFFLFCFSMSRYSMYLESKLQTGHR
ncbi:MAG: amino acid ABC transporter permease [Hyphomicrobiales bacterium]|nr:MAG: amino acid ABC transporter permease [Hyphomicrobiales bacterium]